MWSNIKVNLRTAIFMAATAMIFAGGTPDAQAIQDSSGLKAPTLRHSPIITTWESILNRPETATRWPKWGEVTDKPETATRWPSWNEVTGTPSTFPPSAHHHDSRYVRKDASGSVSGNLNVSGTVSGNRIVTGDVGGERWCRANSAGRIQCTHDGPSSGIGEKVPSSAENCTHSDRYASRNFNFDVELKTKTLEIRSNRVVVTYSGSQKKSNFPVTMTATCRRIYNGTSMGSCSCSTTHNTHDIGGGGGGGADFSDANLKDDITPLDSALDRLSKITGSSYVWKEDPEGGRDVGVIAQDVLEADPDLVVEDDEGNLMVRYHGLIGYLVEGINELSERVEKLEAEK